MKIDIYHTISGDTWDQIAMKVYGKERYMRELMEENPQHIATVFFQGHVPITCPDIPLPMDETLPPWKRTS